MHFEKSSPLSSQTLSKPNKIKISGKFEIIQKEFEEKFEINHSFPTTSTLSAMFHIYLASTSSYYGIHQNYKKKHSFRKIDFFFQENFNSKKKLQVQ